MNELTRKTIQLPLLLLLAGCTSVGSNYLYKESQYGEQKRIRLKGYPITLKVPTHLKITIIEKSYLQENKDRIDLRAKKAQLAIAKDSRLKLNPPIQPAPNMSAATKTKLEILDRSITALNGEIDELSKKLRASKSPPWQPMQVKLHKVNVPITSFEMETERIETEKIFTVDYKRPPEGQLQYRTDFSKDQYIEEIQSTIADNAIQQVSIAFVRFLSNVAGQTYDDPDAALFDLTGRELPTNWSPTTGDNDGKRNVLDDLQQYPSNTSDDELGSKKEDNVLVVRRVVGMRIFALDDPELQNNVMQFAASKMQRSP